MAESRHLGSRRALTEDAKTFIGHYYERSRKVGKLEDLIAKIKADVQIRKIPNRRHRGHTTKEELHELDSRLSTELNSRLWLKAVGRALCLFTTSLHPPQDGCGFKRKGMQWVYDPNFVGVTIHSTREWNITLSLRGTPDE